MTLEELFFNTSVCIVYVGPYSYGELNYCDRLHILITFIYIITPLLTSTHKPVLARAPSSVSNNATGMVTPRSDFTHRRCGRICNASFALNRSIVHVSAVSETSLNADNADSNDTNISFATDTTPARMRARYALCQRNTLKLSLLPYHLKPML